MPVTASQMGSTDKENLMELDSFSETLVLFKLAWESSTQRIQNEVSYMQQVNCVTNVPYTDTPPSNQHYTLFKNEHRYDKTIMYNICKGKIS